MLVLDVNYKNIAIDEKENKSRSIITILAKENSKKKEIQWEDFWPYYYAVVSDKKQAKKEIENVNTEEYSIKKIEEVKKDNAEKVLKLVFATTQGLAKSREEIKELPSVIELREHDIPFAKRFLIDYAVEPLNCAKITKDKIEKIDCEPKLKMLAIDIETLAPERFPDPKKDQILTVSIVDEKEATVLSSKEIKNAKFVKSFKDEKSMLTELINTIKKKNPDILLTYNGDGFDIPYLRERCRELGIKFAIGIDDSEPKAVTKGLTKAFRIEGMQHIDVYAMLTLLAKLAVVNLVKFDLESVVEVILNEKKEKIPSKSITEMWQNGSSLEKLARYNLEDSIATYKIAKKYLTLIIELCRLVKLTPFDVVRASASTLVESLLFRKAFEKNILIPNKPSEEEVSTRIETTYEGGYVKEPKKGLHERIAVLDFSSLHPTIIITHNISPETINCGHKECKEKNTAPNGVYFCTKKKGFVPETIEELFFRRMKIKKMLKEKSKDSKEYEVLNARQHALKIILNSFYGYLGYARSRWYSREAASAITAFSRKYVKFVGQEAEKLGFEFLYGDTDSAFLAIPEGKSKQDIIKFVENINAKLPGVMQLELEGFYKRGIFVTKKSDEKAAKKRYALIDEEGNLKIVGFEYVRRDWAPIAKKTQRKVIEAILKEGNPAKAVKIVRNVINKLKSGAVKKEDLVILTQIKKSLSSYEAIGPSVAAAKKAIARGKHIGIGSVIGYIITRRGKSISERAEMEEFVKEGDYDAEYYINNQVIPAVIKIMNELGYSKDDLIHGGKQKTLGSYW
ncbi:MAG: ribonuclease H-like domain-containing protein [Candidatus Diapherotrites archaeon]|nr:ribonuclease H-like domain-containing protein [Candidatus Diapherotrites archaeon]